MVIACTYSLLARIMFRVGIPIVHFKESPQIFVFGSVESDRSLCLGQANVPLSNWPFVLSSIILHEDEYDLWIRKSGLADLVTARFAGNPYARSSPHPSALF